MNALVQQESTLIGSTNDILALEQKANAKLLILADSHGALNLVREILLRFGADADALIFCGDGFCDIVACIEEATFNEKLKKALPPVIISVRGNGDAESYPVKLHKTENDEEGVYTKLSLSIRTSCVIAGKNVLVVHGNRHGVDMGTEILVSSAHTMDADMIFFAHTHRAYWEESGGTLILNPGSCSSPRTNLPPSFALVSFPEKQERFKVNYFGIEPTIFKSYKFVPLALHSN